MFNISDKMLQLRSHKTKKNYTTLYSLIAEFGYQMRKTRQHISKNSTEQCGQLNQNLAVPTVLVEVENIFKQLKYADFNLLNIVRQKSDTKKRLTCTKTALTYVLSSSITGRKTTRQWSTANNVSSIYGNVKATTRSVISANHRD